MTNDAKIPDVDAKCFYLLFYATNMYRNQFVLNAIMMGEKGSRVLADLLASGRGERARPRLVCTDLNEHSITGNGHTIERIGCQL